MKLFGLSITKAAPTALQAVYGQAQSFFGIIRESFTGAWQKNVTVESTQNILAFSAVYACVSLISGDISKLRIKLTRNNGGIWEEIDSPAFSPVLRKPNRYQTRIQFLSQWLTTKLLHGNAYVFKERDNRGGENKGVVTDIYVLDPRRVTPLIAEDGAVYYQLKMDTLSGLTEADLTVPASEIIHDRGITLWHPLIGVTPIYACGASGTQGIRIQANSAKFFENMSRPSGHLTAPGTISDATIESLKKQFAENFGGGNLGKVMVTGDGLKYEPMTIPANDAQLIEQLRWTVEDVARCFHVPLHKIQNGSNPTFTNIGAFNQDYYSQCLQTHIEAIELLLDEGLALPSDMGTELDLDGLLRMDPKSRAETTEIEIRSAVISPDEARFRENRGPVPGGDSPMMQQQNFSLAALAKRDAQDDPFASSKAPPAPQLNAPQAEDTAAKDAEEFAVFMSEITKGLEHA